MRLGRGALPSCGLRGLGQGRTTAGRTTAGRGSAAGAGGARGRHRASRGAAERAAGDSDPHQDERPRNAASTWWGMNAVAGRERGRTMRGHGVTVRGTRESTEAISAHGNTPSGEVGVHPPTTTGARGAPKRPGRRDGAKRLAYYGTVRRKDSVPASGTGLRQGGRAAETGSDGEPILPLDGSGGKIGNGAFSSAAPVRHRRGRRRSDVTPRAKAGIAALAPSATVVRPVIHGADAAHPLFLRGCARFVRGQWGGVTAIPRGPVRIGRGSRTEVTPVRCPTSPFVQIVHLPR